MSLKYLTAGIVIAAGLTACTQPEAPTDDPVAATESSSADAEYEAYLAFANEAFTLENANEADLAPLVANLPDYASLTWDAKSFDQASGATPPEAIRWA